jgi:ribose transport system substrate-binding protein
MIVHKLRRISVAMAGIIAVSVVALGVGSSSIAQASAKQKTYRVAYLSYSVANSYDAPMLAAAQAVAAADGLQVTVFDGEGTYTTQVAQLQDVINSGQYQGIITQPIYGVSLIPLVKTAIKKGIKVVNIDQILGSSYTTDQIQVKGLSGNVVFFPSKIGTQLAQLTRSACGSANPCKVGLIHNYKGYEPDVEISAAFTAGLAGSHVSVVAQADGLYNQATALTHVSDMMVANPAIKVIVGSDQDCEGAQSALGTAHITSVKLVCYGASAAGVAGVKSGAWYADVAQAPTSEGELGMIAMNKALRTGKGSGSENPVASLPDNGILTKATVSNFTAQWPG